MNERDFWLEMRRGMRNMIAAIDHADPEPRSFWREFRGGLNTSVRAIEYHYRFPTGSRLPIGANNGSAHPDEPGGIE